MTPTISDIILPHIPNVYENENTCLICGESIYLGRCNPTIEKITSNDKSIIIPDIEFNMESVNKYSFWLDSPYKMIDVNEKNAISYYLWSLIPIIKQTYQYKTLYCQECGGSISYNLPECWFCGNFVNVPSLNPLTGIIEKLEEKLQNVLITDNYDDLYQIKISIKRKRKFPLLSVTLTIYLNDYISGQDIDLVILDQFVRSLGVNVEVKPMNIANSKHSFCFTIDFPRSFCSLDRLFSSE